MRRTWPHLGSVEVLDVAQHLTLDVLKTPRDLRKASSVLTLKLLDRPGHCLGRSRRPMTLVRLAPLELLELLQD